jgi:hypothetical protein
VKTIRLEHEIPCGEDRFWEVFFDRRYNEELFREVLGFPSFEVLEQSEHGDELHRRCAAQPKLPRVQRMLARALRRRGFHFIEDGTFDKKRKVWTWELTPNVMVRRLRNRGRVETTPLGDDRVRRVLEFRLEADLPVVGSAIERSAAERMRDGWDRSARFMADWMKSRSTPRSSTRSG